MGSQMCDNICEFLNKCHTIGIKMLNFKYYGAFDTNAS